MRFPLCVALLFVVANVASAQGTATPAEFDVKAAERFAKLALACVHKEYPNKISHILNSDSDVAPPRKLTPVFYGCYDWHSSVHGHWLLVRLIRTFPGAPFVPAAREALRQSLTEENIAQEAAYLRGEGRASFERPYGLAWLLQLVAELREWREPEAQQMAENLRPLEQTAKERLEHWLPKLSNPVRIGEHDQTAFALGLMLDYARAGKDEKFTRLLASKVGDFFLRDKNCPLAYEPSGEDFLSPCLAEADVVRRVLLTRDFARWLRTFLPPISASAGNKWLKPVVSPDPSDPKLAHLDGLNLSRAWMLEGIAAGLPKNDDRVGAILASAKAHRRAGLAAVTGEHYEGGHWLGSFAVYLVTKRGIPVNSVSAPTVRALRSKLIYSRLSKGHRAVSRGRARPNRVPCASGARVHSTTDAAHASTAPARYAIPGARDLQSCCGIRIFGLPRAVHVLRERPGADIG